MELGNVVGLVDPDGLVEGLQGRIKLLLFIECQTQLSARYGTAFIDGQCFTSIDLRQFELLLCTTDICHAIPCTVVSWVDGYSRLHGSECLLVVLGHAVLVPQQCVGIGEAGIHLN